MSRAWYNHFSEAEGVSYIGVGEYFEGAPREMSLLKALVVKDEDVKSSTSQLLDVDDAPASFRESVQELTWGFRAYSQFQDILDIRVDSDHLDLFNRHYCYYESTVYLRESIVSWLDRNTLAALTLLRPFVELAILHLYWYLRCNDSSYAPYYAWLNGGGTKPRFARALGHVFREMPATQWVEPGRVEDLKKVLESMYKALCAYNHTPLLSESLTVRDGGPGGTALENFLYALYTADLVIRQIVYLYVLVYPMSLFPVDRCTKWGFSGPVGIFFDRWNSAILERYLGADDTVSLKGAVRRMPEVTTLLEWYDGLPPLTDDEIEDSWQELLERREIQEAPDHMGQRIALQKATDRALGWSTNYVPARTKQVELSEEILEYLQRRLEKW